MSYFSGDKFGSMHSGKYARKSDTVQFQYDIASKNTKHVYTVQSYILTHPRARNILKGKQDSQIK